MSIAPVLFESQIRARQVSRNTQGALLDRSERSRGFDFIGRRVGSGDNMGNHVGSSILMKGVSLKSTSWK